MVGSTNHLEKLDEGISKRPSRFDRKYEFGLPDLSMRRRYCQFWQVKLKGDHQKHDDNDLAATEVENLKENNDQMQIDFPDVLVDKIAGITDGFSFAYMQEAFVSTLLIIAGGRAQQDNDNTSNVSPLTPTSKTDSEDVKGGFEVIEDVREGFEIIDLKNNTQTKTQVHDPTEKDSDVNDPLDKYALWKEIKVQIALLNKEIGRDDGM